MARLSLSSSQKILSVTDSLHRTLFINHTSLEHAKKTVTQYKTGERREMSEDVWRAKKVVDSTLHPGMPATLLFPRQEMEG